MSQQPNIEAVLQCAVACHKSSDYPRAERLYRDILQLFPMHPDANHNLGVMAAQHGQWEISIPLFQLAVEACPEQIQFWISLLTALENCGKVEQACLLLLDAQSRGISDNAFNALAKRLCAGVSSEKQQKASRRVKNRERPKAGKIKPTAPSLASIRELETLFKSEQFEKAAIIARQLTQLYPDNGLLWKALAVALKKLGKTDGIKEIQQRVVRLMPDDYEAHYNLANTFLEHGDLDRAEEAYHTSLKIFPDYIPALNNLSTVLIKLGAIAEAEKLCRKVLSSDPENAIAHNNLGEVLKLNGLLKEAEACYRRALELKPKFAAAIYNNLGAVFADINRPHDAKKAFCQALELDPDFVEALTNFARFKIDQGDLLQAELMLRKALEINPSCIDAILSFGNLLLDAGSLDEAERQFTKALEIKPGHYAALSHLALLYQLRGNPGHAASKLYGCIHPEPHTTHHSACQIVALLPFGRSGSLFLHSLIDGHEEISTIPGVYLKGWFSDETWKLIKPDYKHAGWRQRLAENIVATYLPLFDAQSRKNVPGNPMANALWLASAQGFMNMGADRSQHFKLDASRFTQNLESLLIPFTTVNQKELFELLHHAFDCSFRGRGAAERIHQIFYHIHNPDNTEMARFLSFYPNAKTLWIVRNPVQSMESWMLNATWDEDAVDMIKARCSSNRDELIIHEQEFKLKTWKTVAEKPTTMLSQLLSPFFSNNLACGIKLEDIKYAPHRIMPKLAAWMGVQEDSSLYDSSFCGQQYWGPDTRATDVITGFDTKSVERPLGKLLGEKDIKVFEILFWPISRNYGYTKLDETEFRKQLIKIRPYLDEPFEFEERFYKSLPTHSCQLKNLGQYKHLHRILIMAWELLERDGTYPGIPKPIILD